MIARRCNNCRKQEECKTTGWACKDFFPKEELMDKTTITIGDLEVKGILIDPWDGAPEDAVQVVLHWLDSNGNEIGYEGFKPGLGSIYRSFEKIIATRKLPDKEIVIDGHRYVLADK